MVNVVGTPLAIHEVTGKGSDEAEQALINIDLCKDLEPGYLYEPPCSVAEVFIVYDVVAHEIIEESGFSSPEVEEAVESNVT